MGLGRIYCWCDRSCHALLPLGAFAALGITTRALLVLADSRLRLPATVATIIMAVVFLVERYRSRHCVLFSSDTVFKYEALLVRRFKTFYQHIEYYTQWFSSNNFTGKMYQCFNITVNCYKIWFRLMAISRLLFFSKHLLFISNLYSYFHIYFETSLTFF